MYKCYICNYETDDRTNLRHHTKSKKHILSAEKHKLEEEKIVFEKQAKEIEELKQKIVAIEKEKEKEIISKNTEIAKLEVEAKIYKELSEKGGTTNNTNNGIIINNSLSYVNKHFKDAPPLEKITDYKLNGIDMDDDSKLDELIDNIVYYHNNKCLHKIIGDHIIKLYKKEDLSQQSFHTTDVSRRKYLVKLEEKLGYLYDESSNEISNLDSDNISIDNNDSKKPKNKLKLENKTKSKWTNDNDGLRLGYLILDPITKKVIKILKKKFKQYNDGMKINSRRVPTYDEIKKFATLTDISKDIDNDKLKKSINTYIAPHFVLDKR